MKMNIDKRYITYLFLPEQVILSNMKASCSFLALYVFAASGSAMRYTSGDAMTLMSLNPILNGVDLKSSVSRVFPNGFPRKRNIVSRVCDLCPPQSCFLYLVNSSYLGTLKNVLVNVSPISLKVYCH